MQALKANLHAHLKSALQEGLPKLVTQFDYFIGQIDGAGDPLDKNFMKNLINGARPLFVDAIRIMCMIKAKINVLMNDAKIKTEVIMMDDLTAIEKLVTDLQKGFNAELEKILTFRKDRCDLERSLPRYQSDETLVDFDQKFVDTLLLSLAEGRDFGMTLLAITEKNMELMLSDEKNATKKGFMSIYN